MSESYIGSEEYNVGIESVSSIIIKFIEHFEVALHLLAQFRLEMSLSSEN